MRINEINLNKIAKFVSDNKYRTQLQNISIKPVGDNEIEIAATDGGALCVMRRKLSDGEEAPKQAIMFKLPKIKKGLTLLEIKDGDKISIVNNGNTFLVPLEQGQFPKYEVIIPANVEKLPLASDFAYFKWEYLKKMEDIIFFNKHPRAEKALSPHFWIEKEGDTKWTVVIMPIKI